MRTIYANLLIALAVCFAHLAMPHLAWADRPNVLIILADDLGFSDLGCYGGEIETPNLDALSANGVRFTSFYNTGRCWPTRASLLTGYYAQPIRRDKLPGVNPSGGGGKRPSWAPLAAVPLANAGYRCYHIGKWHIDGMPVQAGFHHSYYLGDQARFFSPKTRFLNDEPLPEVPRGTDYYATTDLADRAIEALKLHSENHGDKPFFQYIALTAPHFPLHALPEDIAKYQLRYQAGWDQVRAQRWNRIQSMNLIDGRLSEVESQTGAPYLRPKDVEAYGPGEVALPAAWAELTDEQKEFQATKMALHAAMVDRIDQELGRVFDQLRKMEQFENTLILFLSDNGCSSELMIRDDGHDPAAAPGSADTHLCLGPGWSTVCNTPFRKHKTWVHEGGIATPLIAHWPKRIKDAGAFRRQPAHLIDILPTIMELAGISTDAPESTPLPPGRSLVTVLTEGEFHEREMLWWSHDNHHAIRMGNWKAVKTSSTEWELYDLSVDRTETSNLAEQHPNRLEEMVSAWTRQRDQFIKEATLEPTK